MNALTEETKTTRVINKTAAGMGDVNGSVLDMAGFDSCRFQVYFGVIDATAVVTVKAQQATDLAFTTPIDLEGTAIAVADTDDDGMVLLDVIRPTKQFIRCVVTRGTANAEVDAASAIQYAARSLPTTQDATVVGSEIHSSPNEGTA